jgi:hypothetical protein
MKLAHLNINRKLLGWMSDRDPAPAGTVTSVPGVPPPPANINEVALDVDNVTWIHLNPRAHEPLLSAQEIRDTFTSDEMRVVMRKARIDEDVEEFMLVLSTTNGVSRSSPKLLDAITLFTALDISTPAFENLYITP